MSTNDEVVILGPERGAAESNVRSIPVLLSIASLCLLVGLAQNAVAQNNASVFGTTAQSAKPFTFEVVSIRPHDMSKDGFDTHYLPDGFQMTTALAAFISLAYTPKPGYAGSSSKLIGAPQWAYADLYDIQARVGQEDIADWRNDHDENHDVFHSGLLHQGLQAALHDRAKLVVHTATVEQTCLDLTIGKQGPKLQTASPGPIRTVPGKTWVLGEGFYIQDDSRRQFMNVSMEELALLLTRLNNGHLVQDKTGLMGRYDFTLPVAPAEDDQGGAQLDRMPVTSVGLALKPGTAPFINIYVDHIERPDAN